MTDFKKFTLRLNDEEYQILDEKSKLNNIPKSKYLKILLLNSDETFEEIKRRNELLKEIKKEARMIGINIYQISKKLNFDKMPDFEKYKKELDKIWQLLSR